jgi:hypothetical protein
MNVAASELSHRRTGARALRLLSDAIRPEDTALVTDTRLLRERAHAGHGETLDLKGSLC